MQGADWSEREWDLIRASVVRLRARLVAAACGAAGGLGLFLATAWLLVKGGDPVGPHLALLGNYFPGYAVTWPGAFVGLAYGALVGAVVGWSVARVYNEVSLRRAR